jgi:exportin-2 (importin alpha re-exporter)
MRTIATAHEAILPYLGIIVDKLKTIVMLVARNPNKPRFNHFMFEAFAAAIRFTCPGNEGNIAAFEGALFPPFEHLLVNEVVEFQPYVFQLLALMLELRTTAPVPDSYMALFEHLMAPPLWESGANTVPLTRLLQAFVTLVGGTSASVPSPCRISVAAAHSYVYSPTHCSGQSGTFQEHR